MSKSFGVLLNNIGSPRSTSIKDVREYLGEFLMDPKVIDLPWFFRSILVRGIILNTRPPKSRLAYEKIWTKKGSPLIVITKDVAETLQKKIRLPVEIGMRYSRPSIKDGIEKLMDKGVNHILFLPQYPHYAMSSFQSSEVFFLKELHKKKGIFHSIWKPIYQENDYLDVLANTIKPHFDRKKDHLIFSYHGLPEHHLAKTSGGNAHCLKNKNCCEIKHSCHQYCYRHQVYRTSLLVADKLNIKKDGYDISFQSRLNKKWLKPFTDKLIPKLLQEGKKNLVVVCPSFLVDCLETLEEVGIQLKGNFTSLGGESFKLVPCLNDNEEFLNFLNKKVSQMMIKN